MSLMSCSCLEFRSPTIEEDAPSGPGDCHCASSRPPPPAKGVPPGMPGVVASWPTWGPVATPPPRPPVEDSGASRVIPWMWALLDRVLSIILSKFA